VTGAGQNLNRVSSYTLTSASVGNTYKFRITATSPTGSSEIVEKSCVAEQAGNSLFELSCDNRETGKIYLTWNKVPKATNYVITERLTGFEITTTSLFYYFKNTKSGKYYDFSVKARTPYSFTNVLQKNCISQATKPVFTQLLTCDLT
jgi:hypothetical protein